ncbi:N utilization substance protein B [Salmonella enterica subsp. enterica]|nr:N utilization substance protein B [Salmonella enterica subsp. enterica] [Salmonella enterica subsp. enterica serovar Menston]
MKPAARRRARECAVQALYSWQLSQNDIADVEYQFLAEQDVKDVDVLYFRELLSGVATNSAYLDGLMKPYLSRLLEELGQVEKAVLRIALFELSKRSDVPYKWPSTKRLNWRKPLAAEDSHKFVNGVLDKAAPVIRPNKK